MTPRDIGLFLQSARTDAAIARLRPALGAAGAMQAVYAERRDPWASANPRYRYQRRKYEVLLSLLPAGRQFAAALDLGCGLGGMTRRLATRADTVLGIDIAASAIEAATRAGGDPRVHFEQGDALALPARLDGCFDLVVLADVVYYLWPLDDEVLKRMATAVTRLLAPGGVCLLANHYFLAADPQSRRSRRIETAFSWAPGLRVLARHRRAFYLATLLGGA